MVARRDDAEAATPKNVAEREGAPGDHPSEPGDHPSEPCDHPSEPKPSRETIPRETGPQEGSSTGPPSSTERNLRIYTTDNVTLSDSESLNPELKSTGNLTLKSKRSITEIMQDQESLGYETDISGNTFSLMSNLIETSVKPEAFNVPCEASVTSTGSSPAKPRRAIPRLYTRTAIPKVTPEEFVDETTQNPKGSFLATSENHLSNGESQVAAEPVKSESSVSLTTPTASLVVSSPDSMSNSDKMKERKNTLSSPVKSMIPTKPSKSSEDLARTKSLKKVSTALKTLSNMTSTKIPQVSFRAKPPPAKGPLMYSRTSMVPRKATAVDLKASTAVSPPEPIKCSASSGTMTSINVISKVDHQNAKDDDPENLASKGINANDRSVKVTSKAVSVTSKADSSVQSQPDRVEASTSPYMSEGEEDTEVNRGQTSPNTHGKDLSVLVF